ncbi:MAG TPA: transglycosylase [Arthrobacter bacterium]|jgi:septal ring factor EnvC (AmiA/AmiB activator)|nr:transglycosylase [Arthrobacter sp.]HCB59255.1 transglycosylase [Arthrobacter sp.]HCC39651.1 transglycosylase [Arthrobacter sp.]
MSGFTLKSRLLLTSATLAGSLACSALVPFPAFAADDAPPGGFPSWQDVQDARKNEASKADEVGKINALLSGLRTQGEDLGNAAVRSAAEYAVAASALDAASATVVVVTAQSARADAKVARYKKEIGALAAQAYKAGGANVGLYVALDAVESKDSLQRLDVMRVVMDRSTALFDESAAAESAAKALAAQEEAAKAERERLAGEAKAKLEAAQAAQESMVSQIAQQQQHDQELTAQLASLKGTSASVEDQYQQGQAALAAYQAAQEAKRAAAEEQARQQAAAAAQAKAQARPDVGASTRVPAASPPPGFPAIPGGAVNDSAAAQNYAAARLGAFGWGPDQSRCLMQLWNRESSWLTNATNPDSGAYGIAQALPPGKYSSAGSDWLTNYRTQIDWGLGYIRDRYGSPCVAWDHETSSNWY